MNAVAQCSGKWRRKRKWRGAKEGTEEKESGIRENGRREKGGGGRIGG